MRTSLKNERKAFTLVEIMIVMAIIGIILAISLPAFLRAREVSRARGCQENLAKISGAVSQYAIEHKLSNGDTVTITTDLIMDVGTGYLKSMPVCQSGGTYEDELTVDGTPTCSIGENEDADFAPHIL